MSAEFDLDRLIGGWIRDEAPAHAPDRVLETVMGRVDATSQRRPIAARWTRTWSALTAGRRAVLVGVALLILLAGLVVVGAIVTRLIVPSGPGLVIVQPGAESPLAGELAFVVVESDGSRRELGRVTTDQLGGQWGGWPIVLSPDGHLEVPISVEGGASAMAVADLRDLRAPVQRPDFEAGFGSWSQDDRLAGIPNRGGVAIFDPATNTTSFAKSTDENVSIIETDFRAQWAADGSGLLAAQYGDQVTYGVLTPDGTFVPGQVPGFDGALGPRRVRADGARLQCNPFDDSPCEPPTPGLYATLDGVPTPVWTEPDTSIRIVDFAWGADGTVWFLSETLGAGPRKVQLVHITADGTREVHGNFDGVADDPDEHSYFPAASFLTLAPDDSRIVIRIAGDQGSPGQTWVVDPRARTTARLDGTPVGWLAPATLSSPRDETTPLVETDPALRGAWTVDGPDGRVSVTIRRATVDTSSVEPGLGTLAVESTGPDTIRVGRFGATGPCDPAAPGTYRWALSGHELGLEAIDEPCAPRAALLDGTFERELPTPDSGTATADTTATYMASKFAAPFSLTIPASASGGVDQHDENGVSIRRSDGDVTGAATSPSVGVDTVSGGQADPCDRHASPAPIGAGIAGFRAYLEGMDSPTLEIGPFTPTTISGLPGVVTEIRGGATTCPEQGFAVLSPDPSYLTVTDTRLILVEPTEGMVVAITTPLDLPAPDAAWVEDLLGSISFDR